jgi:hypothetical protein
MTIFLTKFFNSKSSNDLNLATIHISLKCTNRPKKGFLYSRTQPKIQMWHSYLTQRSQWPNFLSVTHPLPKLYQLTKFDDCMCHSILKVISQTWSGTYRRTWSPYNNTSHLWQTSKNAHLFCNSFFICTIQRTKVISDCFFFFRKWSVHIIHKCVLYLNFYGT